MSYHSESTIEDQHRGTVNVLSFSGDGRFLATGCEDGIVKVFNTSGGGHRSTYEKEASAIDALIWNPRDSSSLCLYVGTRGGHVFSFQSPEQKVQSQILREWPFDHFHRTKTTPQRSISPAWTDQFDASPSIGINV